MEQKAQVEQRLSVAMLPGIWQRVVFMFENTHGLPFTPLESVALANDIAKQCQMQQAIGHAADQDSRGEKIKLKGDEP